MIVLLRDYLSVIYNDWISLMSGILSLIATILTIITKFTIESQAQYWLLAAVISFVVANIRVFSKIRPQLFIELFDVSVIKYTKANVFYIMLTLLITNTKAENNMIKSLKFIVDSDGRQLAGALKSIPIWIKLDEKTYTVQETNDIPMFKQGEPTPLRVTFELSGEFPLLTKNFTLSLVDSYRQNYQIKGTIPLEMHER